MAWVKSEYAGELAVLSAWLSMVLPWNVVYNSSVPTPPLNSKMAIIRMAVFEVQFRFPAVVKIEQLNGTTTTTSPTGVLNDLFPGVHLFWDIYVASPVGAILTYDGAMQTGSVAWLAGAVVLLGAFGTSLLLYRDEEGFVERSPVDPVRLIGLFLGLASLSTGVATVFYYMERDLAGVPIPVGVVVMGALSYALLTVERKE